MLWTRGPQLQLSSDDRKTLITAALPEISARLGEPVYLNSVGLITHTRLRERIREILESNQEQTSADLIAMETGVERKHIKIFLDELEKEMPNVYFGLVILPVPVTRKLLEKIQSIVQPQSVSDFCTSNNITSELFHWCIERSPQVVIVENYALNKELLEENENHCLDVLADAASPVPINSLSSEPLRSILIKRLEFKIDGEFVKGFYIPASYKKLQMQQCRETLGRVGFVSKEQFDRLDIDMNHFARAEDAIVLDNGVLSKSRFEAEKQFLTEQLAAVGYFRVGDLEFGDAGVKLMNLKISTGYTHYLVRPKFEASLREQCMSSFKKELEDRVASLSIDSKETVQELMKKIDMPSDSVIEQRLESRGIPSQLSRQIVAHIGVKVRQKCLETTKSAVEKAHSEAVRAVDLKIAVYLFGVKSCPDFIQAAVFNEWQQYVIECGAVPSDTIEQGQRHFASQFAPGELEACAAQLVQVTRKKLVNTTDPAKLLLLAIIVYHASHFAGNQGVLRIRGKQIPKLLKAFEFPPEFTELKDAVKAKNVSKDIQDKVRCFL